MGVGSQRWEGRLEVVAFVEPTRSIIFAVAVHLVYSRHFVSAIAFAENFRRC